MRQPLWNSVATVTSRFVKSSKNNGLELTSKWATIPGTAGLRRGMRDMGVARTMAGMTSPGAPCINDAWGVRENAAGRRKRNPVSCSHRPARKAGAARDGSLHGD